MRRGDKGSRYFPLALMGHWDERRVLDVRRKDSGPSGLVQKRFMEIEQGCHLRG